jgi:large subunit ribosomal protein L34
LTALALLAVIAGCPKGRRSSFPPGLSSIDALQRRGLQEAIMKRTYQASKVRRARTHGFLVRMKSRGGRAVINARRAKGRKRLAV